MKALTEKQKTILKFIDDFVEREGMAPTVYEIADHLGVKTSTVFAHLRALQRKEALTRSAKARSIRLAGKAQRKVCSRNAASIPLEDRFGNVGELLVDRQLLGETEDTAYFAMKIHDDALRDFGIFTDDIAIVRQTGEFNPGDMVAYMINDITQIRSSYRLQEKCLERRPANQNFVTHVYPEAEVTIRGVVIALQREY